MSLVDSYGFRIASTYPVFLHITKKTPPACFFNNNLYNLLKTIVKPKTPSLDMRCNQRNKGLQRLLGIQTSPPGRMLGTDALSTTWDGA